MHGFAMTKVCFLEASWILLRQHGRAGKIRNTESTSPVLKLGAFPQAWGLISQRASSNTWIEDDHCNNSCAHPCCVHGCLPLGKFTAKRDSKSEKILKRCCEEVFHRVWLVDVLKTSHQHPPMWVSIEFMRRCPDGTVVSHQIKKDTDLLEGFSAFGNQTFDLSPAVAHHRHQTRSSSNSEANSVQYPAGRRTVGPGWTPGNPLRIRNAEK